MKKLYHMLTLTTIVACTFLVELEVRVLHVSKGNVETESKEHRDKVEPLELVETMRILQKEVQRYRVLDNERMIRAQEEII